MRLVIAGGGTGGHLYSGLSVYEELMAGGDKGHRISFVGTKNGIEAKILPEINVDVSFIPAVKFRRSGFVSKVEAVLIIPFSIIKAMSHLLRIKPQAVLGVGGYASGAVVMTAIVMGLPTAIIEQNAKSGFTNRLLGRWVKSVFLGLPDSAGDFPPDKTRFVGNPVRSSLFDVRPIEDVPGPFTVLVFGGSQGARRINELIRDGLEKLSKYCDELKFIHITGSHDYQWVKDAFDENNITADIYSYFDDMTELYDRAHWVISRSGAMTISELAAAGRPSLLIPYPYAADDHQAKNASYLVDGGAAVMSRQEELDPGMLSEMIIDAMRDRGRIESMGRAARQLAMPGAAREIARWLLKSSNEG